MPEGVRYVEESPASASSVEEARDLESLQVAEPNLAEDPLVAEKALKDLDDLLAGHESAVQVIHHRMWASDRLYRGDTYGRRSMRSMNVHIPEPFKAVETITDQIVRAVNFRRWFGLVEEEVGGGDPDRQRRNSVLLLHELDATNFRGKLRPFVREGLILGTQPAKVTWKRFMRKMKVREVEEVPSPDGRIVRRLKAGPPVEKTVIEDRPVFEPFDVFDLRWPLTSGCAEESVWISDFSYPAIEEILDLAERDWYLKAAANALKDQPGKADPYQNAYKNARAIAAGIYDPRASQSPHLKTFRRLDWSGYWSPREETPAEFYNIVSIYPEGEGGPKSVLMIRRQPWWYVPRQYVVWRPIQKQNEGYGISVVETIATMSSTIDDHTAVGLESALLAASPPIRMGDEANMDEDQLILEPGLALRGTRPDAFDPIVIPDVTDASYKAIAFLQSNIRETTGAQSPLMGSPEPGAGGGTATEFAGRLEKATQRIEGYLETLELDVLVPILDKFDGYNRQFLTQEKKIRLVGPDAVKDRDFVTVTPEDVQTPKRFVILALQNWVNRLAATQSLVNFLDRAAAIETMRPGTIRIEALLQRIFRDGYGYEDAEEFIEHPVRPEDLRSPWDEHKLFAMGQGASVHVQKGENLLAHYREHRAFYEAGMDPSFDDLAREEFERHVIETGEALSRLLQALEASTMMQSGPAASPGGRGFSDGVPNGRSPVMRPQGMPGLRMAQPGIGSQAAVNEPNLGAS